MLRRLCAAIGLVLAGGLAGAFSPVPDPPSGATVTDSEGTEVKVSALKFGAGTRRLAWLAAPGGDTEDARKGPLAVEVREPHSTAFKQGVVTYVPVESVESIKYDYERKVALVAVKGLTEPLAGTLEYQGLNVFVFGGTVDGRAATFSGGAFKKGNIKAVAFPGARPVAPRKGPAPWLVQIDQPKALDPTLRASHFQFLYQFPNGSEVLTDTAVVRKGEPLKLDGLKALTPLAVDLNNHTAAVEVLTGDGAEKVLILTPMEKDGNKGVLVGLLAEVDAGWKLFPLHTIKVMKRPKKD